MYQWILWRHGEAGFARHDLDRPLTERGEQQAQDSAAWLRTQGIDFPGISSQAVRARQTLAYYRKDGDALPGLNPGNPLVQVRDTLSLFAGQDCVIVGHLPWVNQIASELLQSSVPSFACSGLLWLVCDGEQWHIHDRYRL